MPKKFKPKYKQSNNKIIIISIIIVLLLVSSGIGSYFYYKSKQDKKQEITTTIPATTKPDLNTEASNAAQAASSAGSAGSKAGTAVAADVATTTTRPSIISPTSTISTIRIPSETKIIPTITRPFISPRCNKVRCNNIMKFYIDNRPYFSDSTAWFTECDFCPSRYYKPPNAIKINELTINNIESLINGYVINDPARLPITSEQKEQAYEFLKLPT